MIIGIFGGVGSGKSLVLDIFKKEYSACTIQTDKVAHRLYQKGEKGYLIIKEISKKYNFDALDENYDIDRKKLAKILYSRKDVLEELNLKIHPPVWSYIKDFIRLNADKRLIVIESAILPDDEIKIDCKIFVYTELSKRIERLKENRNYTEELIEKIMKNQVSDEFYRQNTDIVLDNSSDIDAVKEKLKSILKKYNIYN